LVVTGATTVNAGTGTITLTDAANDFQGAVSLTGGVTQITDKSALTLGTLATGNLTANSTGALNLGTGTVTGALAANSNSGDISEAAGGLAVTGATTLTAGATNDITLNSPANDFGGTINVVSSRNVTLVDVNNIIIGDINASKSASLKAAGSILNDGIAGTRLTAPVASLTATKGTVGAWNVPVEVDVANQLNVNAGGLQNGFLSVNLQGGSLSALQVDPSVPGMVMLNSAAPGAPLANGRFVFVDSPVMNDYFEGIAQNTARLANEAEDYALTLNIFGEAVFAPYADLLRFVGTGVKPNGDE